MSYIQPKIDYKDGDVLYGIDLNASNAVIKAGVDDNFDRIQGLDTSKQNVLTAGAGIEIENDVISSTSTKSEWGNIEGNIEDQTDLKNALDNKQDLIDSSNKLDYSLLDNTPNIPTKTSDLTNDSGFIDNTYHDNTKQDTLTAGTGIQIENNVISNTQTSAEWGNITGTLSDQTDLNTALSSKANSATTLSGYGITDAYTKTETNTLLGDKVDKVTGKGLSTEDYTSAEKSKLAGMDADAEANIIEIVKVDGTALTPDNNKAVNVDLSGKQETLISGTNIKTINDQSILGSGNITIGGGGGGTSNYNDLENKPQINSVSLVGNKSLSDLGIDIPTKLSDLTNDNNTVTDANYVHTDNNYTSAEKTKLTGIQTGAEVNDISTIKVNGTAQTITSKSVNIAVPTKTSDLTNNSNFVSDSSYVHTDNNYTTTEKNKLAGIESGAQVNVEEITVGSTPTSDTTLLIEEYDLDPSGETEITNEYSESTTLGYSCNYVNNNIVRKSNDSYLLNKDLRVTDALYYNLDMNTIAKNSIYSADEIEIGSWINGKPLYRKVLEFTISSTTNAYVKVNHNIENRGVVVNSYGHYAYSGSYFKYPNNSIKTIYVSGSGFYYYNTDSSLSGDTAYAIIEYTKTTD